MASASNISYSVSKETVAGVMNPTPTFTNFEYIAGSDLTWSGTTLNSDLMKQNRAMAHAVLVGEGGGGSLRTAGRNHVVNKWFIEGVIGGTFNGSGEAKGGALDPSYTIEKRSLGAAGNEMFHRYTGVYVTGWTRSVAASGNVEDNFEFLIKNQQSSTSRVTAVQYVNGTNTGVEWNSKSVGQIVLGSITGVYTNLDLSVQQGREAIFGLGPDTTAAQINASSSPRTTTLTVKMLKENHDLVALKDTIIPVSFTLGTGANNTMVHRLPRCHVGISEEALESSAQVISVTLTALDSPTDGTEIILQAS